MGKNQFSVGVESKNTGNKGAYSDKDGSVLTPRQRRFFLNLATERFKTLKQCAIDAGYAIASAKTNCVTMAKDYSEYIEGLRLSIWEDTTKEEAKKRGRIAKRVLEDLALHSANDNVRRLASRDLLELAGELKNVQDKPEDLTPRDLRQEAQRVAASIATQPQASETETTVSNPVSNRVN